MTTKMSYAWIEDRDGLRVRASHISAYQRGLGNAREGSTLIRLMNGSTCELRMPIEEVERAFASLDPPHSIIKTPVRSKLVVVKR